MCGDATRDAGGRRDVALGPGIAGSPLRGCRGAPAGGDGARADALPRDGGPTPVLGYMAGPIGVLGVVPDLHRASGAALPC